MSSPKVTFDVPTLIKEPTNGYLSSRQISQVIETREPEGTESEMLSPVRTGMFNKNSSKFLQPETMRSSMKFIEI